MMAFLEIKFINETLLTKFKLHVAINKRSGKLTIVLKSAYTRVRTGEIHHTTIFFQQPKWAF